VWPGRAMRGNYPRLGKPNLSDARLPNWKPGAVCQSRLNGGRNRRARCNGSLALTARKGAAPNLQPGSRCYSPSNGNRSRFV
jgi:hypothetical protein